MQWHYVCTAKLPYIAVRIQGTRHRWNIVLSNVYSSNSIRHLEWHVHPDLEVCPLNKSQISSLSSSSSWIYCRKYEKDNINTVNKCRCSFFSPIGSHWGLSGYALSSTTGFNDDHGSHFTINSPTSTLSFSGCECHRAWSSRRPATDAVPGHFPTVPGSCLFPLMMPNTVVSASPDIHLLVAALRLVVWRWPPMADALQRAVDDRRRKLSMQSPLSMSRRRITGHSWWTWNCVARRRWRRLASWIVLTWASYRPSVSVAATGVLKYIRCAPVQSNFVVDVVELLLSFTVLVVLLIDLTVLH